MNPRIIACMQHVNYAVLSILDNKNLPILNWNMLDQKLILPLLSNYTNWLKETFQLILCKFHKITIFRWPEWSFCKGQNFNKNYALCNLQNFHWSLTVIIPRRLYSKYWRSILSFKSACTSILNIPHGF